MAESFQDFGERHIRLVYFLANGCTQLSKELVWKLVELSKPTDDKSDGSPWSLDAFLYENMSNLTEKSTSKQKRQLFPGYHKEAQIGDWDLSLLIHVITCCTDNQLLIQDIKQLKSLRNELYHMGGTAIEQKRFERQVEIIEIVVERCCVFIDKAGFTEEMNNLVEHFKKGQIVRNDEDLQKVRHWYENDPIAQLHSKVDGISEDNKVMMEKLNELLHLTKLNGVKGVILPETNVEFIVRNCNHDKEGAICDQLIRLLNPKFGKDMPEADKEKVNQVVKEAMSELLSGGRELTDAYLACVNLRIKCPSLENMMELWKDCMTGKMASMFSEVQHHLRVLTNCPEMELDVGITYFEFYRVFEATVMALAKALKADESPLPKDQTELFKEITDVVVDRDGTSLFQNQSTEVTDTVSRDGTRVVMRIQPSSFSQAETMWEACQSGAFNKQLEKLANAFEQVYGYKDINITGKLEEISPYQEVFLKKSKMEEKRVLEQRKDMDIDKDNEAVGEENVTAHQPPSSENRNTGMESQVESLQLKFQSFQEKVKSLETSFKTLDQKIAEKSEATSALKAIETLESRNRLLNPERDSNLKDSKTSFIKCLERLQGEIQDTEASIVSIKQDLRSQLSDIEDSIKCAVSNLKTEVKINQHEITNGYIQMPSSGILSFLNSWCSDVGFVIYELKEKVLKRWQQLETSKCVDNVDSLEMEFRPKQTFMETTFKDLLKSTIIVTDQSDYCIRLYKEQQLPKLTVTFLALNKVDTCAVEMKVILLEESDGAFASDNIYSTHEGVISMKNAVKTFTKITTDEKIEITFDGLSMGSDGIDMLTRMHSESTYLKTFYRFVFFTEVEGETYWGLSLPVLVITDPNQDCCALAAVTWKCFDADVFSLPLRMKDSLPWLYVSKILKTKFSRLSSTRNLTEENLSHLKRRLLGQTDVPDECPVSLSQFCCEPLQNCSFTFWKWFLGNFNLVHIFLKQYWEDGLIAGFVSRIDMERQMKQEPKVKSGTFILRFSDNHIADSVGTKSLCGNLTSLVALRRETSSGIYTDIVGVDVAGYKKLRSKSLANILKESVDRSGVNSIYKYLFPDFRKREHVFDVYCAEEKNLQGYIGTQNVFLFDLELELFEARQDTKLKSQVSKRLQRLSTSSDSGISSSNSAGSSRSLSPLEFTNYLESYLDLKDVLFAPETPLKVKDADDLFPKTRTETVKVHENIPSSSVDTKSAVIDTLFTRMLRLAKTCPSEFEQWLNFLLHQLAEDALNTMCESISN